MSDPTQRILVWDPFVRVFHWTLVMAYLGAWWSAEESAWLHVQLGYFILSLIGLRLLWGVIGARHARFSDFICPPAAVLAYLRSLLRGEAAHYLGHNPAGGWMIVALLLSLAMTSATGLLPGVEDDPWEAVHEASATLSLLLVGLHLAGVVLAGVLHRENLVQAMLTGRKQRRRTDA